MSTPRRTLLSLAFVSSTAFAAATGCSAEPSQLDTSPSNLVDGADVHGGDHAGDEAFGVPNDDPALGGDLGEAASDEGGGGRPSLAGGGCVPGGFYCGGDKLAGNPQTLYKCKASGAPELVEKCARGCSVNPGRDDSCVPAPGARVASPVPGKSVTYPFGVKNSGYAAGYHTGDDYATPTGSSAVAVRSGTIRWSNDSGGAYGKWLGLEADNGRTYVYCHLSSRLVTSGTRVTAGQVLAKTGATGNVTGPHLHFEDHPRGGFVYGQVREPTW